MARNALVDLGMKALSGIADDDIHITVALLSSTASGSDLVDQSSDIADAFATMFSHIEGAGVAIVHYISNAFCSTSTGLGDLSVSIYDITGHEDGSAHGSPVAVEARSLYRDSDPGNAIPTECAAVCTLRAVNWDTVAIERPDADTPADGKVDRLRQRHSGRMYFGGFNGSATSLDTTTKTVRVAPALRSAILYGVKEADDLLDLLTPSWRIGVWSRKDAVVREVGRIEVDNAFDTQRRRGPAASVRDALTV